MKINNINIIGSSFYGCNLAIGLSKRLKVNVNLIDKSDDIIKSWESINVNGYKINPGFHAFEMPRSSDLVDYLKKFNVKFKKSNKPRGIILENILEKYSYKYNYKITNFFNLKKNKISYSNINDILNEFKKDEIDIISKSYLINKNNIKSKLQMIYPWFYPNNYDLISSDEGTSFNSLIRNKSINYSYFFPENILFEEVRDKIKKYIKKSKINLFLNHQIDFNKIITKKTLNVICIPVPFLLDKNNKTFSNFQKDLKPQNYFISLFKFKKTYKNNFTEIIILSSLLPGFRRVSFQKYKNDNLLVVEFNIKNELDTKLIKDKHKILFKILKIRQKDVEFIGNKFVRKIFNSDSGSMDNIIQNVYSKFNQNQNTLLPRIITWPINTNKQFLFAKDDVKIIEDIVLNS